METTGPIQSEATKRKAVSAQKIVQEVMSSTAGGYKLKNKKNMYSFV